MHLVCMAALLTLRTIYMYFACLLVCMPACIDAPLFLLEVAACVFHAAVYAFDTLACMQEFCMHFSGTLLVFPMPLCMRLVCMLALLTLYWQFTHISFCFFVCKPACINIPLFSLQILAVSMSLCMHLLRSLACMCSACNSSAL